MMTVIRGTIVIAVVVLSGNATGLVVHFLSHQGRWSSLSRTQIVLLTVITLLSTWSEAVLHEPPEGDDRARLLRYTLLFLVALLTSILAGYKPL